MADCPYTFIMSDLTIVSLFIFFHCLLVEKLMYYILKSNKTSILS